MESVPMSRNLLSWAKSKMLVTLGVLLFVGFLLTSTISYLVSRNAIRTSILQNELPLSSNNIYSEVQKDLFEPILISSLMANDTFVKDWITQGEQDEKAIINYLEHIRLRYGTLTAFLVSENTRKYYNANSVLKNVTGTNPDDRWFFRVREMKTDYEINVDPDMSNHDAMTIFVNYRVTDKEGNFLAATGVGLSVNSVKELMQEYRRRYHRDVYFYDRQGRLVLHSLPHDADDAPMMSNHNAEKAMHSVVDRINRGETDITASSVSTNGTMANYRYIPELNWILVVEQVSDGTRSILFQSFGLNLLICLLTAIALLGVIRKTVLSYQERLESKNHQLLTHKKQLLEANAAREKLFSIIGHDLRGPIGSIRTSLELLSDDTMDAGIFREIRDDLKTGVDHVLVTLGNLMAWGSIQSSSLQPRFEDVNVRMAADEGIQLLGLNAKEKNIQIENAIPETVHARADSHQVQSVLRNLISNAVKFTPKNGRIILSATKAGDHWQMSVQDNGIGMDPERVAALAGKGSQYPSTLGTENEKGLGLGFQLCLDFIRANNGELFVKSSPENGTTVSFTLPSADSSSATAKDMRQIGEGQSSGDHHFQGRS